MTESLPVEGRQGKGQGVERKWTIDEASLAKIGHTKTEGLYFFRDDGYAFRSREFEEEYQERLGNDPSVKKLSPRVAREREKDALPEEERNPRNAGRKPKAEGEKRPSKAIRVPLAIADVLKQLGELSQENPEVLTRCKDFLNELNSKY